MTPIPKGWSSTTLDQIADINPRHPRDLKDSLPVSFVRMPALSETDGNFKFIEERPLGQVRKGFTHFAEGDVLLAKITPCMENGKAAVASHLINGLGCGTTELHVLRPLGDVNAKYIYHFIHQVSFREEAVRNFTGSAGQLRVPVDFVRAAQISLAPLDEQRRIVAKLEKLLSHVDALQIHLATIPRTLNRFRQSVLAAACSGRLTEDWRRVKGASLQESWHDAELREICSSITDGDHLPPPKQPNGIPFLTIGNISSGQLDFSSTRFVSESYFAKIKPERIPKRGDTLYTVVGATIGIPVLVDTDRPFCFQRHIAILKPSTAITTKFLHTLMGSPEVYREAWTRVTGSAQPTLPLGNLRSIPISVPPLGEQQEIVRRVEALFKTLDALEARYRTSKGHVDKLTQSILAKAFHGELVPQDPNDEPASILLSRIKASSSPSKSVAPSIRVRRK